MAKKSVQSGVKELTANRRILDYLIRHGVFIERYKTSLANSILAMFNDSVAVDIEKQVIKNFGRGTVTEEKVVALAKELSFVRDAYKVMADKTHSELGKLAISEGTWHKTILQDSVPVQIDFKVPPPATLKALASETYVRGKFVKNWFVDMGAQTRDQVVSQINIGMVEGQGIEDITRRIIGTKAANYSDGILEASRRNIDVLVRTSVSSINSNVRKTMYTENDDIIKRETWDATLDMRTCQACMALDRQEFEIGLGPQTPLHWNCRCVRLPVLKSWKELGIDLQEAPAGTRASMDGQVPESVNYGRWLKGQDSETQDEILGPGKAALFRRGTVSIDRFIDSRNRPLTLGQLERLESKLKKAG